MKRVILCTVLVFALSAAAMGSALAEGSWQQSERGWQYFQEDGQAAVNTWVQDEGEWYYFNHDGYMKIGWVHEPEGWFYTDSNGRMLKNINRTIHGIDVRFDEEGYCTRREGPNNSSCSLAAEHLNPSISISPAAYWNEDRNVFINEWSNYQITFPKSFDDKEKCVRTDEDFYILDQSDSNSYVYDLMYEVIYEDTTDLDSDSYQHTPASYLEYRSQELLADSVSGFDNVSGVEETVLGDITYKKISAWDDNSDNKLDVYCRQIDRYIMTLRIKYIIGMEESVSQILGTMQKVHE